MNSAEKSNTQEKERAFSSISARSFIAVVLVLVAVLFLSGALSYFIPQGSFQRDGAGSIITDTYVEGEVDGIAIWRIITAPVRVFFSEDAVTIIMICIFLLVMSGIFNLLEKTDGIKIFISRLMRRMRHRSQVVCLTVLIFMLFGSFFGMYEELITLLPIVILFLLSLGMDTMTGLGACLLAACFGFSSAITNPFSVGLASEVAGISPSDGVWLRLVFFALIYATLSAFLILHLRKIKKNPALSPTYEIDLEKRNTLSNFTSEDTPETDRIFKSYAVFFCAQGAVLVLIATVKAISNYAIPILASSFLLTGVVCGTIVTKSPRRVGRYLLQGAIAMLPAVVMIAIASSVKLVMAESGIIDTIMNSIISLLDGKSKFLSIILIYFLILFLQFFIGSASAKIFLVMPIVMPISVALGLSPEIVILAYCMADGFSDVIIPTNPILLVALSIANVSYVKWVKWTWKLQLLVFTLGMLVLLFGISIGY